MSTDVLRRNIARELEHLLALQSRGLPPVTCVFSRLEGEAPDRNHRPRFSPLPYHEAMPYVTVITDAAFHPSLGVTGPFLHKSHLAGHGGNHFTLYAGVPQRSDPFADLPRPSPETLSPTNRDDPVLAAIRIAQDVGERMKPLIRAIPAQLAERLGFVQVLRPDDWVEALFHLGWHFPDHGIEADRFRILSGFAEFPRDFRCLELDLQLGDVRVSPDVFPGVIVSRLGAASDFLTASASALRLILESLDGTARAAQPQPSAAFGRLRDDFLQMAEAYSHHPRELSARVLRLGDSFRTPTRDGVGGHRPGRGRVGHPAVLRPLAPGRQPRGVRTARAGSGGVPATR